jgi:hypothetical protein
VLLLGGFGAALFLSAASAKADWHEFWHRVGVDFHRNNAWPEPFQSADRQITREYFRIQVNNGWRMQNTIGNWFFDEETHQLNQAGEIKLRQVATQSPVHRRTVFVLMGSSSDITARRVDSVQQTLARILPDGPIPQVLLTDVDLEGGSGEYFDRVNSAYNSSTPSPRLSSGGSGGGTGGAGGTDGTGGAGGK